MSNPSILQDDVFTALVSFLASFLPAGTPIVQGIQNGVPMPATPFVCMTPLYSRRLETNLESWADTYPVVPGNWNFEEHADNVIQIDCYGPQSADWAKMIETLWRSEYATTALAPTCAPLYIEDPKMMVLVNGEENYEQRWMVEAHLQYNPVTTVPLQFFTSIDVTLHDVM